MQTGFEFSDIYDETVSRAGGEQSTAEDVVRVRRSMRLLMERWEAKQYNTWRIRSIQITGAGGVPYIVLPDEVDDVMQVVRETGGALERITAAAYMQISKKTQMGVPGSYWLSRDESPKLYLHPMPSTGTLLPLQVWYVERPANFDRQSDGMDDIPGRWLEALITGLAHDLARKRPSIEGIYDENLIQRLKMDALEAEDLASRADRDRARYRYRIS
jgi:hypothetical protein